MNRVEFGNRLRTFIKEKFGTYEKGAAALNMKPPSLQTYLKGESLPGAALTAKLLELGCDINWLFDVKEVSQVSESLNKYSIKKNETILSQAQEITELKKEVKLLEERIQRLQEETNKMLN